MAAVLAGGQAAVLSHTSAAELWGMLRSRRPPSAEPVLTKKCTSRSQMRRAAGSGAASCSTAPRTLNASHCTRRDGIPVTTPVAHARRTFVRSISQPQFAAALREAEFLRLPLDDSLGPDRTRSELEARLLALCRRHRLAQPEVNVRIGGFVVDFAWR